MDSVTGFQCTLAVTDGALDASVAFTGVTVITIPSEEVGEFEETELDQKKVDNTTPDKVRRWAPNDMIECGALKCEQKYSAANHARIRALLGVKGKTWLVTPPEDNSTGSPMTCSGLGYVRKIEDIVFEKGVPVAIKFEVRQQKAWTFTPAA